MNQLILASHGEFALGARDTLSMIIGNVDNIHVITLKRDDKESVTDKACALIASFDPADQVFICTDMLGSSVNNSMVEIYNENPSVTVISGMNMPLILSLALESHPIPSSDLQSMIRDARAGLRDISVTKTETSAPLQKKPTHVGKGGPANVVLVRLDYRLLHGQVVFSWVNSVGAQRIIVVDNDAATNEVKKNALKLAKPSGTFLNIFTVNRALAKMKKLNTLGENVMFIFGNVHEMLEFCQQYQGKGFESLNFGAAANHDGAIPIGGKDSSVFLDASERADAQKLLDLGIKIYEQQTPSQMRTDISSFR